MNRFLSIGARFVLSALATATLAQEPPKASVLKPLTPEASLDLRSISDLQFSPDGRQIAILAPDAKTEAEEKKEKDKDDAHVADKEDKHARLWLLTLDTGDAKALTEPQWKISEAVWHPSGTGLVLSATDHPESDQNTERIFSFRLRDTVSDDRKAVDSMTQVLAPRGPFGNIRIATDGQ